MQTIATNQGKYTTLVATPVPLPQANKSAQSAVEVSLTRNAHNNVLTTASTLTYVYMLVYLSVDIKKHSDHAVNRQQLPSLVSHGGCWTQYHKETTM
jgi:hypothetical protein